MMEHILFLGLNDKNTRAQEIATLDAYKITMAAATVESMEDAERLTGIMNAIGLLCNVSNGGKA